MVLGLRGFVCNDNMAKGIFVISTVFCLIWNFMFCVNWLTRVRKVLDITLYLQSF